MKQSFGNEGTKQTSQDSPKTHESASTHERIDEKRYEALYKRLKKQVSYFPIYPGLDMEGSGSAGGKASKNLKNVKTAVLNLLHRKNGTSYEAAVVSLGRVFEKESASPKDLLFINNELKRNPGKPELKALHAIISYLSSKLAAPEELKWVVQNSVFSLAEAINDGAICLEFFYYFYKMYPLLLKNLVVQSSDLIMGARNVSPKSSYSSEISRLGDDLNRRRHVAVTLYKEWISQAHHIRKAREILKKRKKSHLRFKLVTEELITKMQAAIVTNNQPLNEISDDKMNAQDLRTIMIALLKVSSCEPIFHDLLDKYEPKFLPGIADKKFLMFKQDIVDQKAKMSARIIEYFEKKSQVFILKMDNNGTGAENQAST